MSFYHRSSMLKLKSLPHDHHCNTSYGRFQIGKNCCNINWISRKGIFRKKNIQEQPGYCQPINSFAWLVCDDQQKKDDKQFALKNGFGGIQIRISPRHRLEHTAGRLAVRAAYPADTPPSIRDFNLECRFFCFCRFFYNSRTRSHEIERVKRVECELRLAETQSCLRLRGFLVNSFLPFSLPSIFRTFS